MRRKAIVLLLGLVLLALLVPGQALAGGRHRGHHGHGHHGHHFGHHGWHHGPHISFGFAPAYYYWGPPWWAGYHHTTTVVVEEPEPPVYIERRSGGDWWYYCEAEGGYYPSVETCPEPWVKVAPRPE